VLANYARIARWSAVATAAVAVVMVAVCAAIGGSHGLVGAALGVALVAIFFGIDIVALGRAARVSPQMMMLAAIGLYLFKIIALAVAVSQLRGATFFSARLFGFTAIVCILAWCAAQVTASIRLKTLYVEPDGER
jgi:ATP synthase protein I